MTVADTDVLVDFLQDRQPAAAQVEAAIMAGRRLTTVVSRFELLSGVRTATQETRVRDLQEVVPPLPLTPEAAERAAETRRELERKGEKIGSADCLIAGIVLANGARLLNRNRRHFARIPHLELAAL